MERISTRACGTLRCQDILTSNQLNTFFCFTVSCKSFNLQSSLINHRLHLKKATLAAFTPEELAYFLDHSLHFKRLVSTGHIPFNTPFHCFLFWVRTRRHTNHEGSNRWHAFPHLATTGDIKQESNVRELHTLHPYLAKFAHDRNVALVFCIQ